MTECVGVAQGQVVCILGAAQDITVRKWAEEERLALERKLLETQKLESLGMLAGGIAHDFNNLFLKRAFPTYECTPRRCGG